MCTNNKLTAEANYDADPNVYEVDNPEVATFKITDVKLFVPVVTLSKENDIQLLEQLKQGSKELLNGTSIDHKCLFNLKITT